MVWHLAFDIAGVQIYGDREDVILTCSCYSIEDFVDEMKEMLTIQTGKSNNFYAAVIVKYKFSI